METASAALMRAWSRTWIMAVLLFGTSCAHVERVIVRPGPFRCRLAGNAIERDEQLVRRSERAVLARLRDASIEIGGSVKGALVEGVRVVFFSDLPAREAGAMIAARDVRDLAAAFADRSGVYVLQLRAYEGGEPGLVLVSISLRVASRDSVAHPRFPDEAIGRLVLAQDVCATVQHNRIELVDGSFVSVN